MRAALSLPLAASACALSCSPCAVPPAVSNGVGSSSSAAATAPPEPCPPCSTRNGTTTCASGQNAPRSSATTVSTIAGRTPRRLPSSGRPRDRQRAIDYFLANTPKTQVDVTNEVDRYVAWPGQALAYTIGEIELRRLWERAKVALGPRVDVRELHDVVLREGALPLDVLGERVDAWIVQEKGAKH